MNKIFNLYNCYHLGDSVFTLHFLNKYKNFDYNFNYFVKPEYITELNQHITNEKINLFDITKGVPANSYNTWIGHNQFFHKYITNDNHYDLFYVKYFKMLSETLQIENFFNNKEDMLFDNSNFKISTNKSYDYLLINSKPFSGQLASYNERDFIDLCDYLTNKNFSFITTQKVKDYECTRDYKMSLIDIGNLSNYCSNIVAINTAPIIRTFTIQNINTIKNRFILDDTLTYSFNDSIYKISKVSDLYQFI